MKWNECSFFFVDEVNLLSVCICDGTKSRCNLVTFYKGRTHLWSILMLALLLITVYCGFNSVIPSQLLVVYIYIYMTEWLTDSRTKFTQYCIEHYRLRFTCFWCVLFFLFYRFFFPYILYFLFVVKFYTLNCICFRRFLLQFISIAF